MSSTRWDQRFFASTRGQVLTLLRQGHGTVEDLARELGLTDNAVRSHLTALERDGLVTQSGLRRGVGKPAHVYTLTPDAERFFPKAYGPVLQQVVATLGEELPAETVSDLMRDVGHHLAAGRPAPTGDLRERVDQAVAMLGELGGMAEVREHDGGYLIEGRGCPLAAAVEGSPCACLIAETMLGDVIGAPVRHVCDTDPPSCRFEVGAAVGKTAAD